MWCLFKNMACGAVGALASLFLLGCSDLVVDRLPAPATDRPIQTLQDGYVSSDRCQACHPAQYRAWHQSYHRTMTQVVTPETVAAPFDPTTLRYKDGSSYRLERKGDEFWIEVTQPPGWLGNEPVRSEHRLLMSTGSHFFQAFWFNAGTTRVMKLMPFFYSILDERWMPVDAAFVSPPEVFIGTMDTGRWNFVCLRCHTTRPRPRISSMTEMDTRVAELGIACEACHGPAEEHIAANRNPKRRYEYHLSGKSDPTIVNPTRLPPLRASEVCGQCHAVLKSKSTEAKVRFLSDGHSYQPGDVLESELGIKMEGEGQFWSDGMIRVSGREYNGLIRSPCYLHGDEERGILTCFSCHQLHQTADDTRPREQWAHDQVKANMLDNHACEQCHAEFIETARLESHTGHEPTSSGSSCYNCHMPYTGWGLLGAIRSHEISNPSVDESLETGRPNACNLCHLDKTLAWAAEHLEDRYGLVPPELDADETTVAASILWTLKGDAGQRALMAWAMGWETAEEISGTDWMVPYLAQLMEDPYDAVRYRAHKSLQRKPGYETTPYDSFGAAGKQEFAARGIRQAWRFPPIAGRQRVVALLIDDTGKLDRSIFERLLRDRDERPVTLAE